MFIDIFLDKIRKKDSNLGKEELKTGLIEVMTAFIEKRIILDTLLEAIETLRTNYRDKLTNDMKEVITTLHDFNNSRQDTLNKQMSKETIAFMVDDLLDDLMMHR